VSCFPQREWSDVWTIQRHVTFFTSASARQLLEKSAGRIAWREEKGASATTPRRRLLFCCLLTITRLGCANEKLNHGDALSTKHDEDTGGKESIVDKLLEEQEFMLEEAAELEDMLVVCDAENTSRKKAVKEREEWIVDFKARPVCGEMLRFWAEPACATRENAENASSNELPNKKERDKKKKDNEGLQERDWHSR
jgi:hypothetical protein